MVQSFASQRSAFSAEELGLLALADVLAFFFAPLLSAALFESAFAEYSSGFLLKSMTVSMLVMMALFLCCGFYRDLRGVPACTSSPERKRRSKKGTESLLRGQGPTLSKSSSKKKAQAESKLSKGSIPQDVPLFPKGAPRAAWIVPQDFGTLFSCLVLGTALTYPFWHLLSQVEHFSAPTPILNIFVTYVLLLPQRVLLLQFHLRHSSQKASSAQVYPILAAESLKVLLVGTFADIETFMDSKGGEIQADSQHFEPIAAVTPNALDFGRYIGEVPVVGEVASLPGLIGGEDSKSSFQCLFVLGDVIPPETQLALKPVVQKAGLSVLTLKPSGERVSAL